jgi:hypothetical protein
MQSTNDTQYPHLNAVPIRDGCFHSCKPELMHSSSVQQQHCTPVRQPNILLLLLLLLLWFALC